MMKLSFLLVYYIIKWLLMNFDSWDHVVSSPNKMILHDWLYLIVIFRAIINIIRLFFIFNATMKHH